MIELELQGKTLRIKHSVRIGREPEWAELVLFSDRISRHHAEIRLDDGCYRVWDMGSQNGTRLNGKPVGNTGVPLAAGDVIQLGDVIDVRVVRIESVSTATATTSTGPDSEMLSIHLEDNQFIVHHVAGARIVRDTMPYQLGLALSVLAHYQLYKFGPVADVDLRAIVWRGDDKQMRYGDINRLLGRIRGWFRDRDISPPGLTRAPRSRTTRLEMPAASLRIKPDGWLEKYLEE